MLPKIIITYWLKLQRIHIKIGIADKIIIDKRDKYLFLNGLQITDISPLENLKIPNLETLAMHYNSITDISKFPIFPNLKALHLDYNIITDISRLSMLLNLEWLTLPGNLIAHFSCLAKLPKLRILELHKNKIENVDILSGVGNFPKLNVIYLWDNLINRIDNVINASPDIQFILWQKNQRFIYDNYVFNKLVIV